MKNATIHTAKGDMKEYLISKEGGEKKEIDEAVSFLCRNVQFGTLDISVQRAAMCID